MCVCVSVPCMYPADPLPLPIIPTRSLAHRHMPHQPMTFQAHITPTYLKMRSKAAGSMCVCVCRSLVYFPATPTPSSPKYNSHLLQTLPVTVIAACVSNPKTPTHLKTSSKAAGSM